MATHTTTNKQGERRLARGLGWFSIALGLAEVAAPQRIAKLIGIRGRHGLIRLMGLREIAHGVGILSGRQTGTALWTRVAGDALDLAFLGAAFGMPSANKSRLTLAAASVLGVSALDMRAAQKTGRNGHGRRMTRRVMSITINRPVEEVYAFWRDFENLPRFMSHLESVETLASGRSRWKAKAPAGMSVEWQAEITQDKPNELIAWRSLEGSDIENSGSVRFNAAPGGRGTEVHATIDYAPPAGKLGSAVAMLFGREPGQQIKGDLYRFKQVMETGEVMHSDASIHRLLHPARPPKGEVSYLDKKSAAASLDAAASGRSPA